MESIGHWAPGRNPWGKSTATHHSVRLGGHGELFYCQQYKHDGNSSVGLRQGQMEGNLWWGIAQQMYSGPGPGKSCSKKNLIFFGEKKSQRIETGNPVPTRLVQRYARCVGSMPNIVTTWPPSAYCTTTWFPTKGVYTRVIRGKLGARPIVLWSYHMYAVAFVVLE